jgi:hypothetical protein
LLRDAGAASDDAVKTINRNLAFRISEVSAPIPLTLKKFLGK